MINASNFHDGLEHVVIWIDQNFSEIILPTLGDRNQIAIGCFDIAIECQAGMLHVCKANTYALMFSGQRSLFEAVIRGMWFLHCATDVDIENYKAGSGTKSSLLNMVKSIEAAVEEPILPLRTYLDKTERFLHHFTHTGFQHVTRRFSEDAMGPNYPDSEVSQMIGLAALLGLQAAARLAVLAGEKDLEKAVYGKMVEYVRNHLNSRDLLRDSR